MKLTSILTHIAACSALALAGPAAHAELYNFKVTGDYTASWQLDSNAIPDEFDEGFSMLYYDVVGFSDAIFGLADVRFFNAAIDGGLLIEDIYTDTTTTLLIADGPQLYTGSESAPVFTTGTFSLTEFGGSGTYTLTIAAAVVPEPASVAMLLAGLGVVGAVVARRRKTEVVEEVAPV